MTIFPALPPIAPPVITKIKFAVRESIFWNVLHLPNHPSNFSF